MKAFIGKTTGEEVQLKFTQGVVVIQPFEEVAASGGGGGGGGGALSAGADLMGGMLGAI